MVNSESNTFRVLDELMLEDEYLFRFGITHLLSVGYENLTDEAVQKTIQVLEAEAEGAVDDEDKDAIPVIIPEYQITILKTAVQIREVPIWVLLKYISRKVKIAQGCAVLMSITSFFFFVCMVYGKSLVRKQPATDAR